MLGPPLNSKDVNRFVATAVEHSDDADLLRAEFEALPVPLQPFALEQLEAYSHGANDAQGRIAAGLALGALAC
jgi:hypothetical protein